MRIIVTNVYSFQNKGDAAIVFALLKEVNRAFKKPDIYVQTTDVINDQGRYGPPVSPTLLWLLLSSVRDKNILLRLWVAGWGVGSLLLYLQLAKRGLAAKWLLSKPLRQFVDETAHADLVIACGGGYLRTASSSLQDTLLLIVTCLNFLVAKFLGKPVYLYSQSIGPVHGKLQTVILKYALKRVDLIEPREDVSVRYLESLQISTPMVLTADPALILGEHAAAIDNLVLPKKHKLMVGITVRKWFKTEAQFEAYLTAVAKTIDYLIEHYDAAVFYIPQVVAKKFGDDDRVTALKVQEKVTHKANFQILEEDYHPYEVIGLCARMDIFIGTRMHSNIFALISHVPVLAIEYEHKTRGIMRGLGLEDFTVNIGDAHFDLLKNKVDELIAGREEYRQKIQANLPLQIAESQRAIEVIREDYAGKVA